MGARSLAVECGCSGSRNTGLVVSAQATSERVSSAILEGASLAVLVLGPDGAITEALGETLSLTARVPGELVGRQVAEVFRHAPEIARGIEIALASPRRAIHVDVDDRAIELRFQPNEADGATGLIVAVDVTAHARQDEAVKETERQAKLMFRQIPGAAWTTDRELRIVHFLGEVEKTTGIAEDRIVGMSIQEIVGTTDPTELAIANHLAALVGRNSTFRYRFRNDRWYEVRIEALRDGRGEIVGCTGAAVDVTERKAAEERSARNETLIGELQDVAHIGAWQWDIQANQVTWTDELFQIYGLDEASFGRTYESFIERVHPEDAERTKTRLFNALRNVEPFTYDQRIIRPNGEVRTLHTRGTVIADATGKPVHMAGVSWDVTEQWRANERLEHAVSLLESTLESTADGLLVVDTAGDVVTYNQRFLSLWQIPPDLAESGKDEAIADFVAAQLTDPEEFLRGIRELYASSEEESFDVLHFKDSRVFERYSRPQRVDDVSVGRVWSFRDVTERERLLARALFMADASRLLTSLEVETALEGVARLAVPLLGDGCAIDLFGEGAPRRLLSIARDASRPIAVELPAAVIAGNSMTYVIGGVSYVSVPLIVRGRVSGVLTLMAARHRTYSPPDLETAEELARRAAISLENTRLYRATKDAVRTREEFLAVAAHEIRGPLTSMRLTLDLLRNAEGPTDKLIEIVDRGERRLSRLVDELLDLGRARSGRLEFVFEPVDLAQVVRDVTARMGPELTKSGSPLSIRVEREALGTWDHSRIDQIVSNLLSNAIRFGLGKPIEVTVETVESSAVLTVTDHGIGIDQDMIEKIFEPFERAVPAQHYGGLGLGLYIVRTIVHGLGGTITVRSAAGRGSTFEVVLPLRSAS